MTAPDAVPIPTLLAHEPFLRELAARLVADPATADDVVQETWLAALRRPPRRPETARSWLATVARNAARMSWRSEERRGRRERAAARGEAIPSPGDVVERERARRTVVAAVLRLDEPYRDTIVLRFYEGLPPREVAARLGLPVETVRTRTRRALERLRADLDRRHGRRSAWTALLAPLAPTGAQAAASSALGGPLVMAAKLRLVALVLFVLLAGGGLTAVVLHEGPPTGSGGRAGRLPAGARGSTASAADAPTLVGRAEREGRSAAPAPPWREPDIFRKTRARASLRGLVLSGRTHAPVPDARVLAIMERGDVPAGMRLSALPQEAAGGRTDAEGRFVLDDLPVGAWRVRVEHPEEGRAETVGVARADPPVLLLYPMPVEPDARDVAVRVVDETGRPVAGARVECVCGLGATPIVARTDASGLATLPGVPDAEGRVRGWITAAAPEGLGRTPLELDRRLHRPAGAPKEIVLAPAGILEGSLRAPSGSHLAGTRVSAYALRGCRGTWANAVEHETHAAADGTFRFDALPAGTYTLLVRAPGLRMDLVQRADGGPPDWTPLTVEVAAGDTAVLEVPLLRGGTVRGAVRTADGTPVAGCRVEIHLPQGPSDHAGRTTRRGVPLWHIDGSGWPDGRRFPLTFRTLETDAAGRYEASGLLPGDYRIRAVPDEALSFDRREPVVVRDGDVTRVEHVVGAAGTLELVARPFASLGLGRRSATDLAVALVAPEDAVGALSVPGLPVGAWEVVQVHADASVGVVRLATFEIAPGEITYVDVSDSGDHRARLRVLDRDRPVAGAQVEPPGPGRTLLLTDDEGWASWGVTTWGRSRRAGVVVTPHETAAVALEVAVDLASDDTVVSLPSGALRVVVRDTLGRTVAGASVRLEIPAAAAPDAARHLRLARETHRRTTDTNGSAGYRHVPSGTYRVAVRVPETDARATTRVVVGDGATEVEVSVREPGTVRLLVLQPDGAPAADVPVGLLALPTDRQDDGWDRGIELTENGWRTNAEGVFVVRGVPGGAFRAHAWVLDERGRTATHNARAEARLRSGETIDVTLRLRPLPR